MGGHIRPGKGKPARGLVGAAGLARKVIRTIDTPMLRWSERPARKINAPVLAVALVRPMSKSPGTDCELEQNGPANARSGEELLKILSYHLRRGGFSFNAFANGCFVISNGMNLRENQLQRPFARSMSRAGRIKQLLFCPNG